MSTALGVAHKTRSAHNTQGLKATKTLARALVKYGTLGTPRAHHQTWILARRVEAALASSYLSLLRSIFQLIIGEFT